MVFSFKERILMTKTESRIEFHPDFWIFFFLDKRENFNVHNFFVVFSFKKRIWITNTECRIEFFPHFWMFLFTKRENLNDRHWKLIHQHLCYFFFFSEKENLNVQIFHLESHNIFSNYHEWFILYFNKLKMWYIELAMALEFQRYTDSFKWLQHLFWHLSCKSRCKYIFLFKQTNSIDTKNTCTLCRSNTNGCVFFVS